MRTPTIVLLALLLSGCPVNAVEKDPAMAKHSKLDPMLQALLVERGDPEGTVAAAPELGVDFDKQGRVQIYVHVSGGLGDSERAALEAHGLAIELVGEGGVVQGRAAPRDLPGLAAVEFVKRITPASPASTR